MTHAYLRKGFWSLGLQLYWSVLMATFNIGTFSLLPPTWLMRRYTGLWICGSSDSPFKVLFVATNTDENFLRAGLVIPGFD